MSQRKNKPEKCPIFFDEIYIHSALSGSVFEGLFLLNCFLWFGRPKADSNPRRNSEEKRLSKTLPGS